MNLIDEIELEVIELSGDIETAQIAGECLRDALETLACVCGIPIEALIGGLE